MSRRDDLLQAACAYAVEHGLIGLSLRPLAAALGTSDRMLIYHFGSRDRLVSEIIRTTIDQSVAIVEELPAGDDPADAVLLLWRTLQSQPLRSMEDVYIQAAATGLLGEEPYRSAAREANDRWCRAMAGWFVRSGVPESEVHRVIRLIDAAFLGLHINVSTDDAAEIDLAVNDLARLVQAQLG